MNFRKVPSRRIPRIFVVGGGFGGIQVVRALAGSDAQVTLFDKRNYHLFQPLLYQVATATLSPGDIAAPIRSVLRDVENCRVVLAKVRGVDLPNRRLLFERVAVEYDRLVLATGAITSYYGRDDWMKYAPGLKTIEDATEIRRRILLAFETAEHEADVDTRIRELTFVVIGGGPTGVELAGAIKEIATQSISGDFRFVDTKLTRVLLFHGEDRLLSTFSPELSARAHRDLERIGVSVHLNARVTEIDERGVSVGAERFPAQSVFWAAGVKAEGTGATLGVRTDRGGRVIVERDLTVPGYPEVFVIGDLAHATQNGGEIPGVAQAAVQMGRFVGEEIRRSLEGQRSSPREFRYHDRGMMATIGKSRAVAEIWGFRITGFYAWILWGIVHVVALVGFRNRIGVAMRWFWSWVVSARDVRLITGDARLRIHRLRIREPRAGEVQMEQESDLQA